MQTLHQLNFFAWTNTKHKYVRHPQPPQFNVSDLSPKSTSDSPSNFRHPFLIVTHSITLLKRTNTSNCQVVFNIKRYISCSSYEFFNLLICIQLCSPRHCFFNYLFRKFLGGFIGLRIQCGRSCVGCNCPWVGSLSWELPHLGCGQNFSFKIYTSPMKL